MVVPTSGTETSLHMHKWFLLIHRALTVLHSCFLGQSSLRERIILAPRVKENKVEMSWKESPYVTFSQQGSFRILLLAGTRSAADSKLLQTLGMKNYIWKWLSWEPNKFSS